MSSYRAVQVTGAREFALVDRDLVDPAPGHVRLRVQACGICHSDVLAGEGLREDPSTPIVPGHEIVGVIDAVGQGVGRWQVGDRVGVGFLGGPCLECDYCRRGDFVNCVDQPHTGTHVDGGYAEVAYARASSLVRIPDGLSATDAAPLLCAGITVHNALRGLNLAPGSLVAIQGIGGLGHLGLQHAARMDHRVVAIARGAGKQELARSLGADHYVDSEAENPGQALQALGGADAIIATAASGASMSPLIAGLAPHGRLVIVGAAFDPVEVSTLDLIFGDRAVVASLTGKAIEIEDNLAFSRRHGIAPVNEVIGLEQAADGYARMMNGDARFRIVIDIAGAAA